METGGSLQSGTGRELALLPGACWCRHCSAEPHQGNRGWFPSSSARPSHQRSTWSSRFRLLVQNRPRLPASSLRAHNTHRCHMSQKRKDREEKKPQTPLHCTMSSNFPSRTNYSKIYLQSLNYQRQLEGGGEYKPIKNILTFEYHNGVRGWMLPRLPPTKKGLFCFSISTHAHYRQL